jgi:hypothetical protein
MTKTRREGTAIAVPDMDLSARLTRVSKMLDQAVEVLNDTLAEIKGKDDDERHGTAGNPADHGQ